MPNRTKNCHYCNEEFQAKRRDAMYCSNSCKMMAYRCDHELNKRDNIKPLHLELDYVSYEMIRENAEANGQDIVDYVKSMCKYGEQEEYSVQLSEYAYYILKKHVQKKYPEKSLKDAFNTWILENIMF